MKNERIIEKARKLRALSSSSNPHEAALALSRMQAILIKYGLEESDLDKDEFGRITFLHSSSPWARRCINGISALYFCRMVLARVSSTLTQYIIIGHEQNALVVKEMAQLVLDSIKAEAKHRKCHEISFKTGASMRISERCIDLIAAATAGALQDDCGEALVIGDMYQKTFDAIDEYVEKEMQVVKGRSRRPRVERASFMMGALYGETVELQKKIN